MKVLLINKYNYYRRGAESVFLDTKRLLEQNGHEVVVFAMDYPKNLPSPYSKYFVSFVDTENPSLWTGLKAFFRSIYSFEAARKLEQLISDAKPDIAHLHNIYHQISPSILRTLKKHKIPVILTAHDYKLICPSYQIKSDCPENIFAHAWHCAAFKQHKNSYLSSAALAMEWLIHKIWRIYERNVDMVIAPSQYVYEKFVA